VTSFRFQDPLWLLLLVPVVVLGLLAIRRQRRVAVLYSDVSLLERLPQTLALRVKRLLPWLWLVGLALIVMALARPQRGREEFRLRTEGIAIQMCLDRSGSMQAMDFELDEKQVNRLEACKRVFRDFVAGRGRLPGRPDDAIGLIAFGGYAEAKCPLTLDHGALLQVLNTVEIPKPLHDSAGRVLNASLLEDDMKTAIGDTLALATQRLKDVAAKSRIIILLSDGEQTAGVLDPVEAAKAAKTFGIKIYTVGVGSTGLAPMPFGDRFGGTRLRPVPVRLDEKTLTEIAETTGGRYFNAKSTEALEAVYAEIDKLEKSISEGRLYTEYREWYQYLMFPGITLIVLQVVLVSTRFRSLP